TSVTDGRGHTTSLGGWKRGVPQTITYPDASTQTAVVNHAGHVQSITDQLLNQTHYTYDTLGRLAGITYPGGDPVAWAATSQTFAPLGAPDAGFPAGTWRQTVSTGAARRVTYFDGLWRPLLTHSYDSTSQNSTQRYQ